MSVNWIKEKAIGLGVYYVASIILEDPRFSKWSGSSIKGQHHYGTGGLLTHTTEVVKLCLMMAETFPEHNINKSNLFLSALYHDCGKMWDYKPHPDNCVRSDLVIDEWISSDHKRLIHHISRSALEFSYIARKRGFPEEDTDAVLHAILSHHTSRAAGSPVAPDSRIAWILTLCDNLSARINDADSWDLLKSKIKESHG